MAVGPGAPSIVLVTGLGWLVLSSLLGLAILIGIIRGTPLPPALTLIHVHGASVGGLLQVLIGLCLMSPTNAPTGRAAPSFRFLLFNMAAITLLAGFGLRHHRLVGAAGIAVLAAVLFWGKEIWRFLLRDQEEALHRFYYGFALFALAGGLIIGAGLSFDLLQSRYGHARLAHIHFTVLAFITLTFIGLIQRWVPAVLGRPVYRPGLDTAALILLPAGTAGLLTGFWLSSVEIQLTAGGLFFIGIALQAFNQLATWIKAGQPGASASDHLLASNVFIVLTTAMGLAVGFNSLWSPPFLPYGTLHMVAYTHGAFIGFMLQAMMGGLSFLLPAWIASRIAAHKKRSPYLAALLQIMNKWRAVQLFSLSVGTLGLSVVASLTWSMPINSMPIHAIAWTSVGLLAVSMALFCAKVAQVFAYRPSPDRTV
jgi:hypothetical protein